MHAKTTATNVVSLHPERPRRLTPADRMRVAADAAHGETLRDAAPIADERRHGEGSEEYLDRLARALRRAAYVVHAPGAELCVPYSEHAAEVTRLDTLRAGLSVEVDALLAEAETLREAIADASAEGAARHAAPLPAAPVAPRKSRPVPMPTARSLAAKLLATFAEHRPLFGEEGMTAAEATASARLPEGAWKRVSDLATLGLIGPRVTNDEAALDGVQLTRKRHGDRLPARVWVITPAGREHHAALAGGAS